MRPYQPRFVYNLGVSRTPASFGPQMTLAEPKPVVPPVTITDDDLRDHKALGQALRKQGLLPSGESLKRFDKYPGAIIAYPRSGDFHSIVLATPVYEAYKKLAKARKASQQRMMRVLLNAGESSYILGESPHARRERALKITRSRKSR